MAARSLLLGWLDDPATERGIRFARPDGEWDEWSYARLADRARRVAGGLIDAGVRHDNVVSFVQRSGPDFVGTLFGAMLAGAVPSPIAPPMASRTGPATAGTWPGCSPPPARRWWSPTPTVAARSPGWRRAPGAPAGEVPGDPSGDPAGGPAELALLQFTSGLQRAGPRGASVPYAALEANVRGDRPMARHHGRPGRPRPGCRCTTTWG